MGASLCPAATARRSFTAGYARGCSSNSTVTLVTEPQGSIQRAAGPGSNDVVPAEKEEDGADEEEQEEQPAR
jgi:hypothetical protein